MGGSTDEGGRHEKEIRKNLGIQAYSLAYRYCNDRGSVLRVGVCLQLINELNTHYVPTLKS